MHVGDAVPCRVTLTVQLKKIPAEQCEKDALSMIKVSKRETERESERGWEGEREGERQERGREGAGEGEEWERKGERVGKRGGGREKERGRGLT